MRRSLIGSIQDVKDYSAGGFSGELATIPLFLALDFQVDLFAFAKRKGTVQLQYTLVVSGGCAEGLGVSANSRRKQGKVPVTRSRRSHRRLPNGAPDSGLQNYACERAGRGSG
jgi:hypothetical protein